MPRTSIALIGYGEVGRILAEDLRARRHDVCAFDVKLAGPERDELRAHATAHEIALAESHATACRGAELVISAVTPSQAVAAAEACLDGIEVGAFFLDLNSATPGHKKRAAFAVNAARGRYVEGALMTSVPPHRIAVPLLLGGRDAAALVPRLEALGFQPSFASETLGVVSATKMCRSVMIKGLEAMLIESFTAARHYRVEEQVIASLRETFPGIDWEKQAAYFFQRVLRHGRRRAEEMREVAVTVEEAGLTPWASVASAERQAWAADLADAGVFGARQSAGFAHSSDWRVEADRILERLKAGPTQADGESS
jgi:3-hydroxyisobutyrate dehydrogenase-like beta-hydroxyacid dehydrogenase